MKRAIELLLLASASASLATANAVAQEAEETADPVVFGITYKADISGVVAGAGTKAGRFLDNLELTAEANLGDLFGWNGARAFAHVLSNSGGAPNDIAGTLQGVNNIEVSRPRLKLYQFWVEQEIADGQFSVLGGLYDLNSEFYQTDAAGLLIAPAFGIGSELAATGPNGPSIFPSTSLALRGRWSIDQQNAFQGAALNANAGVLGDPDGVDYSFDDGALIIGEWVHDGGVNVRVGAWRYTEEQDDIRETDVLGDPLKHGAHGLYASIEGNVGSFGDSSIDAFLRAGAADGHTTPYAGGWQAGLLMSPAIGWRPDSAFSIGVNQGLTNARERANQRDLGGTPSSAESAIEITYADKIGDNLTLQPDLQFIHNPGADQERDTIVVLTLRAALEY